MLTPFVKKKLTSPSQNSKTLSLFRGLHEDIRDRQCGVRFWTPLYTPLVWLQRNSKSCTFPSVALSPG